MISEHLFNGEFTFFDEVMENYAESMKGTKLRMGYPYEATQLCTLTKIGRDKGVRSILYLKGGFLCRALFSSFDRVGLLNKD